MELVKLPPQAIQIEEALIGSILLESEIFDDISMLVTSDMFYKDAHQKIYNAITFLHRKNKQIDTFTIIEELKSRGELEEIGGPFYLNELTTPIASTAHAEGHAYIIKDKFYKREFIRISSELSRLSYDDSEDLEDITNFAERELLKITETSVINEAFKIQELIPEAINKIEIIQKSKNKLQGVPSGLTKLDRITNGWKPSNLIILAARPSMGKTALALEFSINCAEIYGPCLFFSLEMSKEELAFRMLASTCEIDSEKLNFGNLNSNDWNKINIKISRFEDIGLFIDDSVGLNVFKLRSKCRRYKKKYDLKLIIIDYLQLIDGDSQYKGNDVKLVGSVSRMCKMIAKELNLPVMLLSQLNRSVETRANKFPELSDLRSSGEIEQDADLVIFPTRYKKVGYGETDGGEPALNLAKIDVKKNRNGVVDFCDVWVSNDVSRWRDEEIEQIEIQEFDSNLKF